MRGYSYQILRSIRVWLDLGDDEILVLEGAEDLDRVAPGTATVEQIKDTAQSGNLTLRSKAALDAIAHYWDHRVKNPDIKIHFRFLTTAAIGTERGDPFGYGLPGISLWQEVRADPCGGDAASKAESIKSFLAQQPKLAAPARNFLAGADAETIIQSLILPIEWIAGQAEIGALIDELERQLVLFGARHGASAHDSVRALGSLHLEAWKAATSREGRILRRADLLRIFEGATTTAVPNQQLSALISQALQAGHEANYSLSTATVIVESRPRLPPRYFSRPALEQKVATLVGRGTALIQGATGTGKTSLAAAAVAPLGGAGWINLRDLDPHAAKARLVAALELLTMQRRAVSLILDDIDTHGDGRSLEAPLADLRALQTQLGGSLLITAAQDLSPRLAQAVELTAEAVIRAPKFERGEIEAYLLAEGCPEKLAAPWGGLIEATSSGHPQLVHARVAALKASDFPRPIPDDLVRTPQDILDVRAEARRLVALLPDDARELLSRASLHTDRLSRDRLIKIARISPAISEPGAAIDVLTGPWLEYADSADFRVSPLVRDAATQIHGIDWVRDMHRQLSWLYLTERVLTPMDVSSILLHCTVARAAPALVHLLPHLLQASPQIWEQIAEVASFYLAVGIDGESPAPIDDALELAAYRIVQYRIAAEKEEKDEVRVGTRIQAEWSAHAGRPGLDMFRYLFLSQLLLHGRAQRPVGEIIALGTEFVRLGNSMQDSYPERARQAGIVDPPEVPRTDYSSFLVLPLMKAIRDATDLAAFLDHLATLSAEDARMLLGAYAWKTVEADVAIEQLWLAEIGRPEPRWLQLRQVLERAVAMADGLQVPALKSAIAPVLIRMIDENMADPAEALRVAEALTVQTGAEPYLRAATAKVIWRSGDPAKALDIWAEALPRWQDPGPSRVSAYRDAGIAAAKLKRWAVAEDMFRGALARSEAGVAETRRVGLIFDIAHALLMQEECAEAVTQFGRGVAELEPLEPISTTEPVLSMQKRAGAVISAIHHWLDGDHPEWGRSQIEQLSGICSILDPVDWDKLAPTPTDYIVLDLVRLETRIGGSRALARRYAPRLRRSREMPVHGLLPEYLFPLAVEDRDFSDVVKDGLAQVRMFALARSAQEKAEELPKISASATPATIAPNMFELLIARMITSLFAMAASDQLDGLPRERWRADVPAGDDYAPIRKILDEIDDLLFDCAKPWDHVQKALSGWQSQLVAALAATVRQPLSPEQTLMCHGIWGHYLAATPYYELTADFVAELVCRQWSGLIKNPAMLVMPALSVPAIEKALAAPVTGWARTKGILTAALGAVTAGAAQSVADEIRAIRTE